MPNVCLKNNVILEKTRTKVVHKKVSQGFNSWEALNPKNTFFDI